MKRLLFLGASLVALASQPVMAQTSGPDVVVMKVAEFQNNTQIVIARAESKVEVMELEGGAGPNAMSQSAKRVQQVVTKLYAQGYVLKSTYSGYGGNMSTLVFVKGQ
jgi:opacity protein-like surface antigen